MTTSPPRGTSSPTAGVDRRQQDLSRLARGGGLNLAGSLVNALATMGLVVIITRNLGPGASGAFFLAAAIFQVLATAGQLGADTGLGRFIPLSLTRGDAHQLRTWTRLALAPVALVGVVTGGLAFAFAEPVADVVADGRYRDDFVTYLRVLSPFVALGAVYFVLQTGSRAFGTMRPSIVVERLARPLLQPVAMLTVFALGVGPAAVAWAWIGPYAGAAVALGIWYAHQVLNAERRNHPDERGTGSAAEPPDGAARDQQPMGEAREAGGDTHRRSAEVTATAGTFWRFSSPRAAAGMFQVAVQWLGVILLGALASTREAGIYSASSRWLVGGLFVVFAINQAFQPQISALLAQADTVRSTAIFETATAWAVALVWPVYLVLAVFGPVLMRVFGNGFGDGADALLVLAVGGMVTSACGPVDMVLLMGGRSAYNLFTAAAGLAINLIVTVALVPHYGTVGAAVGWSLSLVSTNLLAAHQVRRTVGLDGYGSTWRRAVIAALAGAGIPLLAARLLIGATVPGMVVGIAVGAAVYGLFLWRWRDVISADALRAAFKSRRGPRRI